MNHENEFCCDDIEFHDGNDNFFIPEDCCPKIETVQFSSPRSSLPKEQLEELVKEIEQANQLLLDLDPDEDDATERPPDMFDRIFHRLHDQYVNIKVERIYRVVRRKNGKNLPLKRESQISGFVRVVGRDFVLLENKRSKVIVPYDKIMKIGLPKKRYGEVHHMLDPDPKLRRALTFNFGEVVSLSPALILHFFTVDLKFFLENFETKQLEIGSKGKVLKGRIIDANEKALELKQFRSRKETKVIPYADINYMKFY